MVVPVIVIAMITALVTLIGSASGIGAGIRLVIGIIVVVVVVVVVGRAQSVVLACVATMHYMLHAMCCVLHAENCVPRTTKLLAAFYMQHIMCYIFFAS